MDYISLNFTGLIFESFKFFNRRTAIGSRNKIPKTEFDIPELYSSFAFTEIPFIFYGLTMALHGMDLPCKLMIRTFIIENIIEKRKKSIEIQQLFLPSRQKASFLHLTISRPRISYHLYQSANNQ